MRTLKNTILRPTNSLQPVATQSATISIALAIMACLFWTSPIMAQFSDITLVDRDESHIIQVQGPAVVSCTIGIVASPVIPPPSDPPVQPFHEGFAGYQIVAEGYYGTAASYQSDSAVNVSGPASFEIGPGLQSIRFWLETFDSASKSGSVTQITVTPLPADPDLSDALDTTIPAYGSAWQRTTAVSRDGVDSVCIQSDNADFWNDKAFWIETPGPGTLKFWYRADADNGQELHLREDADADYLNATTMVTDQWVQAMIPLTGSGPQAVSFGYAGIQTGDPDYRGIPGAMYIDQLEFIPQPVANPAARNAVVKKIKSLQKKLAKAKKKKKKPSIKRLKRQIRNLKNQLKRL